MLRSGYLVKGKYYTDREKGRPHWPNDVYLVIGLFCLGNVVYSLFSKKILSLFFFSPSRWLDWVTGSQGYSIFVSVDKPVLFVSNIFFFTFLGIIALIKGR